MVFSRWFSQIFFAAVFEHSSCYKVYHYCSTIRTTNDELVKPRRSTGRHHHRAIHNPAHCITPLAHSCPTTKMASFSNAGSRRDGGARQEHADAIQVINPFPTTLTARQAEQQKAKQKQKPRGMTGRGLRNGKHPQHHLAPIHQQHSIGNEPAFPTLDDSTSSNAALRQDSYQAVWDALHTQLQVCQTTPLCV